MATMRDIKRRIKSVGSIKQITRAMKMVAAAKLRRSQERMLAMRPYADEVERLLLLTLPHMEGMDHPLLVEHGTVKKIGALVISSDRGLCGGFNSNLVRKFKAFLREKEGTDVTMIAIGRKIARHAAKHAEVLDSYTGVFDELSYTLAFKVSERLNRRFTDGDIQEVYLIYNQFKSMMTQEMVVKRLLPFDVAHLKSLIPPDDRSDRSGIAGRPCGRQLGQKHEILVPGGSRPRESLRQI